ncbi:AbrB/MazE/SpoVT family DNA-binding domain-containing protein [Candidatus Pacearchaeota archaeon]|nr:AbrB/MazE/SpoVT family DNA-binding domain-containing protein [Candidatus Pacearchaeota archaeon]
MKIITKPKQWGNSLGIILPKEMVRRESITKETEITVEIEKGNPIKEIFGSLKGWKINAQKFKDELRKEEFQLEKRKWKHLKRSS